MLINNNNITTYGAKLINRSFSNHEVVNINEWLEGASEPLFLRSYERLKQLDIELILTAANDEAIYTNVDKLVQQLKRFTIKFSDLTFYFDGYMEGEAKVEKLNSTTMRFSATLNVHKTYKAEVSQTANGVSTRTFMAAGTLETPAHLTIVPTSNIATYTITGLTASPIVLKNLASGSTYIVDGYTYRFLKNGASDIANFAGFEFPTVKAGSNSVGFSSTSANVTIKYYPKFN